LNFKKKSGESLEIFLDISNINFKENNIMQNPCLFFQKEKKSRHIFNLFNLKEILQDKAGLFSVGRESKKGTGAFFLTRCSILT
jgi:hypothetical protein